jgi:hypothetical protein
MTEVPVRTLSHLSRDEVRAYILADNKLAENAGWDRDVLAIEMQGLIDLNFDIELLGFSTTEIDFTIEGEQKPTSAKNDPLDLVEPLAPGPAVNRVGDLWRLGPHRLLCGDARSREDVSLLCGGSPVALLFTDPPYNVPIAGHVSGLGHVKHREFAVASGEMDEAAFTGFLRDSLGAAASHLKDGAIAFVCMDWRHMGELLHAGRAVFSEFKNLCVWNKTNGGMGSFYRSKHELVFVFKIGGSGSTLIAAEQCGRVARLLELDPLYCDTIIRRFERVTGEPARLEGNGSTFQQISGERLSDSVNGRRDADTDTATNTKVMKGAA